MTPDTQDNSHQVRTSATHQQRLSGPAGAFPRRRLAVLIASTLFLHACSTLPTGEAPAQEEGSDLSSLERSQQPSIRRQIARQVRNIGVPAWDLDSAIAGEQKQQEPGRHIWHRVVDGFGFALGHENEQVQEHRNWFLNNPDYLLQVTENASPFIYAITREIESRSLPLELALIPIVESAYNPNARSPQNAVGLWQFMGPTANAMGLQEDWWYDGRRDPLASTSAALDYLQALYAQFNNDWLLALAAYNAGQGTVQRAIQANISNSKPTDFWSLSLPRETHRHVPRILGLAHALAQAETHEIALTPVPDKPFLASIDAGSQIDLALVADIAGLEPEMIYQLNPGFTQWATHPDGPHTILVPASHAQQLSEGLAQLNAQNRVTWDRYVIQRGDTLSGIASRFRTQVSILQQVNELQGSRIVAGDSLLIPRAYNSSEPISAPNAPIYLAASSTVPERVTGSTYQVRPGDSLWLIANRNRLSMEELAQWNNIELDSILRPGQTLRLQPTAVAAQGGREARATAAPIQYRVRPGDSLYRIANQHGLQINEIAEWNGMRADELIHPGQQLILHVDNTN